MATINGTINNDILNGTTSADLINGLGGNDSISAGNGDDTLDGGSGADTLIGGAGSDTYIVDSASDVVIEATGTGAGSWDLIQSSVSFNLNTVNTGGVEDLTLTGTAAINGTGNALNNFIEGNSADNVLDGGTGADTLFGADGNDTYIVNSSDDVVYEFNSPGAGDEDWIQSSVSFNLNTFSTNGVEDLTLTGTAAINGTGNALDNFIEGNSGDNVLDGGTGADTLFGADGNDTYIVTTTSDVVYEFNVAGAGTADLIQSSISYNLNAFATSGVEDLTLAGTAAINGTGNALNNFIQGNTADNVLDGGTGADSLFGAEGNDTYIVDSTGDVVYEFGGAGTGDWDLVQSSVTFTLNTFNAGGVEDLTLTGTAAINGTGNALNNFIQGNSGNNVLNGGTGADTLYGAEGDDTYIVNSSDDVVYEFGGAGTGTADLIETSVSFSVNNFNGGGIEKITLSGTGNTNATGNGLDNTLLGNSGNNVLDGGTGADTLTGGGGSDTLIGGTGGDTYLLSSGFGVDRISETDTTAANVDDLRFQSANYNQLWFKQIGNDLEISVVNTSDKVTVAGWFDTSSNHQLEQIHDVPGGHLLTANKVSGLVSAMSSFAPQDMSAGGTPAALISARNAAWV